MNTLIMSDRVNQTLCELWYAKARLLADAQADPNAVVQACAWIDRHLTKAEVLQAWLDHREQIASGEGQANDEKWAVGAASVTCSESIRHSLMESGFERTWKAAPQADRAQVQRELASLLLDSEALEDIVDTVFSAEKLPPAWLKIMAGADAVEPRVVFLETGEWLRVITQAPTDGRRVGVEMELIEGALRVCVSGLKECAGRTIDAALATLNSDPVFTAFPLPKAYPVEQHAIDAACLEQSSGPGPCGAGLALPPRPMPQQAAAPKPTMDEWLRWRQRAEMCLDESRAVVIDADGRCEFSLAVSEAAEPLADKVLVVAVGKATRPEGRVRPPGPRGRNRSSR